MYVFVVAAVAVQRISAEPVINLSTLDLYVLCVCVCVSIASHRAIDLNAATSTKEKEEALNLFAPAAAAAAHPQLMTISPYTQRQSLV